MSIDSVTIPAADSLKQTALTSGESARRVRWRLTRTGQMFLVISLCLYLSSLTSQSGFLLFIIGIFLGCYFINLFAARRMVRRVELHPPASVHLAEGQRVTQPWRITNTSRRAAGMLQVDTTAGTLLRVGAIEAGATTSVLPEQVYWRRGVYSHGEVKLSSHFPFGLIQAVRSLELNGEVVVYPAVYETQSPRAAGFDTMVGGKYRGTRRGASGSNFAGLRPFQSSDPLKQIHWKSSSKGLGLMTKIFEEELSGRVAVIIDCGHTGDEKILDDCVRAAGSLAFAALDAGHHVEWVDLDSLQLQLYPPFTDGHEILDMLARVEIHRDCQTAAALQRAVEQVTAKSAICLVLTELTDEAGQITNSLLAKGRVVSLYLPEIAALPRESAGLQIWTYTEHAMVERA